MGVIKATGRKIASPSEMRGICITQRLPNNVDYGLIGLGSPRLSCECGRIHTEKHLNASELVAFLSFYRTTVFLWQLIGERRGSMTFLTWP